MGRRQCTARWLCAGQSCDLIEATRRVVQAFRGGPHIFNLGHGITPDANPENVQLMIDTVRSTEA